MQPGPKNRCKRLIEHQLARSLLPVFNAGPAQEIIRDSGAARDQGCADDFACPPAADQAQVIARDLLQAMEHFPRKEIEAISVSALHGLQIEFVENIGPSAILLERLESGAREPPNVASMVAAVRGAHLLLPLADRAETTAESAPRQEHGLDRRPEGKCRVAQQSPQAEVISSASWELATMSKTDSPCTSCQPSQVNLGDGRGQAAAA
jgi:hypothetical protein